MNLHDAWGQEELIGLDGDYQLKIEDTPLIFSSFRTFRWQSPDNDRPRPWVIWGLNCWVVDYSDGHFFK
jgi:hypothetical protein